MDHTLQLEHRGSMKTSSGGVARFRRSADVFFALASIASLALLLLSSFFTGGSLSPPAPPARLLSAGGIFFVTKKQALFLLSNAILLFLAADYSCFFAVRTPASDAAACDPGDVLVKVKQARHRQQEVQQRAIQSAGSCSGSGNSRQKSGNTAAPEAFAKPVISVKTTSPEAQEEEQEEDVRVPSKPELGSLDHEADGFAALEARVPEEPTCGTAQDELDKLEIDELNKKFDEFIQSRRIKWINEEEEEAFLQLQPV